MHWDFWNFRKRRREDAEAKAAFLAIIQQRCVSVSDYEERIAAVHRDIVDVRIEFWVEGEVFVIVWLRKGADGTAVARAIRESEDNWKPMTLLFEYEYREFQG